MHYIIEFAENSTQQERQDYLNLHACEVDKTWDNFSETVLVTTENTLPESPIVVSIVDNDAAIISPLEFPQLLNIDRKFGALDSDSSASTITFSTTDEKDWWKNYIQFSPEFENTEVTIPRRGHNIPVYILDSGITRDHSEFENVDIENIWTVTPDDFSDPNGHGTAIASVISGETCGLASSPLKIVKIFRSDRGTYLSEFLDALNTVLNHIDLGKLAVVNCSWSIPKNELIESKFQKLLDRGILVVAAAGNNGLPIGDVTPGSMTDVLAVGSYGPDLVPSDFSNYQGTSEISYTEESVNSGPVNIWAPGEKIWAATKEGGFGYTAGTSMSAAIASMILSHIITDYADTEGYALKSVKIKKIYLTWSHLEDDYDRLSNDQPCRQGVVGKTDLLDLSNPVYSEANNYVMSLPGNYSSMMSGQEFLDPPLHLDTITRYPRAGKVNFVNALMPFVRSANEIYLTGPIPEFCSFEKDGTILVDLTEFESSSEIQDEFLEILELPFYAVFPDNSSKEFTVKLKIVSEDLQVESLAEDHEIVITLSNNCQTVVIGCFGPDAPVCSSFCPANTACCAFSGFKGSLDCNCFAFV